MRRAMWHRHGKTASRKQLQLMERQPGMRKRGDVEGRGRGEQSHTLDALYPRASSDGRLAPLPETGVDADVGDALRPSTSLPRYMRPLQRGARPLTAPGIEDAMHLASTQPKGALLATLPAPRPALHPPATLPAPAHRSPDPRTRPRTRAHPVEGTVDGLQSAASSLLDHPLFQGPNSGAQPRRTATAPRRHRPPSDGEGMGSDQPRRMVVARIKKQTNTIAQDEALWHSKGMLRAREDLKHEADAVVRAVACKVHDLARERDLRSTSRQHLEAMLEETRQKLMTQTAMMEHNMQEYRSGLDLKAQLSAELEDIRVRETHELQYLRPTLEHLLLRNKDDNEQIYAALELARETQGMWEQDVKAAEGELVFAEEARMQAMRRLYDAIDALQLQRAQQKAELASREAVLGGVEGIRRQVDAWLGSAGGGGSGSGGHASGSGGNANGNGMASAGLGPLAAPTLASPTAAGSGRVRDRERGGMRGGSDAVSRDEEGEGSRASSRAEDSGLATDPSRPPRSRLEKSSVPRHPAPPRLQVVDSNALEQLPQDQLMEAYLGPGGAAFAAFLDSLKVRHGLESADDMLTHLWMGPRKVKEQRAAVEALAEAVAAREARVAAMLGELQSVRAGLVGAGRGAGARDAEEWEGRLQRATDRLVESQRRCTRVTLRLAEVLHGIEHLSDLTRAFHPNAPPVRPPPPRASQPPARNPSRGSLRQSSSRRLMESSDGSANTTTRMRRPTDGGMGVNVGMGANATPRIAEEEGGITAPPSAAGEALSGALGRDRAARVVGELDEAVSRLQAFAGAFVEAAAIQRQRGMDSAGSDVAALLRLPSDAAAGKESRQSVSQLRVLDAPSRDRLSTVPLCLAPIGRMRCCRSKDAWLRRWRGRGWASGQAGVMGAGGPSQGAPSVPVPATSPRCS